MAQDLGCGERTPRDGWHRLSDLGWHYVELHDGRLYFDGVLHVSAPALRVGDAVVAQSIIYTGWQRRIERGTTGRISIMGEDGSLCEVRFDSSSTGSPLALVVRPHQLLRHEKDRETDT